MSQPNKRKNISSNKIISDKKLINEDRKTISKQVKPKTSDEEIEYYIDMKNWKLSNEVDNYALELAFPDEEARLIFVRNLLDYYNACVLEYKRIERVMPNARNNPLFFKAKTWREKILKNSKLGATLAVTHTEEYIENLENEILAHEEEQ
ncbi:hypothetical protein C2G38_2206621 [Gigaspora rosea]|uniref:Uncharacterized protein n=1 Tax=Gigaspora rosea TaxID=44941 RepID=A0A397UIZ7_9GLOM|nr:hypothetical protein C2G38_2206621 [Gigaspora rosea]